MGPGTAKGEGRPCPTGEDKLGFSRKPSYVGTPDTEDLKTSKLCETPRSHLWQAVFYLAILFGQPSVLKGNVMRQLNA